MSEPRQPLSRTELTRDVVILLVLHLACYLLVWREADASEERNSPQGIRGWKVVRAAPVPALASLLATGAAGLLVLLALWQRRLTARWILAGLAAVLASKGLDLAWRVNMPGAERVLLREGLLLAALTQLWLVVLAVAAAAGVGARPGHPPGGQVQ